MKLSLSAKAVAQKINYVTFLIGIALMIDTIISRD